jgi:hypothetical protein
MNPKVRTISVPRSLNEAMKWHPGVNWSAVACKAFNSHLRAIMGNFVATQRGLPPLYRRSIKPGVAP